MIIVDKVWKSYSQKPVLRNINITLPKGACIGLMGKSGSGKSTLGRIISGIEKADKGKIYVKGADPSQKFITQVVFQNAAGSVNPNFTVREVLTEAFRFTLKQKRPTKAREFSEANKVENFFEACLEDVGLGHINLEQLAHSLSGGQLQRLCLARSLMLEPDIIILDEAISGLDPLVQKDMLKLLTKIRLERNMTTLFIAHDLGACYYLCDSLYLLHQGEVVWESNNLDELSYEELECIIAEKQ